MQLRNLEGKESAMMLRLHLVDYIASCYITHICIYTVGAKANPEVDENTCQGCGNQYDDDDEAWIGCDVIGCCRWYHYWCAGYRKKPRKTTKFICTHCKTAK